MNYGNSISSWKPWRWVRLGLILMMSDTYINCSLNPLTKFTSSNRSTEFKDIMPWNISQMIMKTIPITIRIVISYVIKPGIPLWVWQKVNGHWDNIIRISEWREHHCTTNTRFRRRRKPKRAELSELQLGIWVGKQGHLRYKNYNRVHQPYQFHQNRLASP